MMAMVKANGKKGPLYIIAHDKTARVEATQNSL
jgi:predicted small lipoprotein YifL